MQYFMYHVFWAICFNYNTGVLQPEHHVRYICLSSNSKWELRIKGCFKKYVPEYHKHGLFLATCETSIHNQK